MSGREQLDRAQHSLKRNLKHHLLKHLLRRNTTPDRPADERAQDASTCSQHAQHAQHAQHTCASIQQDCQPSNAAPTSTGHPTDFSPEEACFANALRARFAFAQGDMPPRYAQTLIGDDPSSELVDTRSLPFSNDGERALIERVFQALGLAAGGQAPGASQRELCEAHIPRSSC